MSELTIHLQTRSGKPLYEQIYEYIKNDIQKGRLKNGEKLPSTRTLAKYLELSRSTVELAYEQLLSEGYIEAEPCRGYFVAQIDELFRMDTKKRVPRTKAKEAVKKYRYDFSPTGVDLKSFPYSAWRKLSKECLLDDKAELFRLGDPKGEWGLRNAIADYLYHARGADCRPEQIIVGAGNDYLLMLLSTVLGKEYKIALENPTYKQAYRLFQNLSYEVCTVDMDENGMLVKELKKTEADIAFVMPSHQYPLGTVMPLKRRMALLQWAEEKEERYIIEDDYDSEFRYKGKPIPALKGYDRSEKVIYMGTFSKSIAPAIRMSYMVLPEPVLKIYEERCSFVSSTVSKVDQMILQQFLEQGYYERHLNKTRALYKGRHDVLLAELKSLKDLCTVSGENAGVHLLLHFRDFEEKDLVEAAAEKGVLVCGLSEYYVAEPKKKEAVIMLGYANMKEEKIKDAVRLLEEAWRGIDLKKIQDRKSLVTEKVSG